MGGSASKSTAAGTRRLGPAKRNGEARSLQIGSSRRFRPPIWSRNEEWPTQVMVNTEGSPRGNTKAGTARGKVRGSALRPAGILRRSRSVHLRKSRNACVVAEFQGFRKPPPRSEERRVG